MSEQLTGEQSVQQNTNVRELKRPVSNSSVALLEELLEQAKRGELNGIVVLVNRSSAYSHYCAGETDLSKVILPLIGYVFNTFAERELVYKCPKCDE